MADDLKAVIRKLMDSSIGQGHEHYRTVRYANHLDYEKWNNHQRRIATDPVFEVMGKFLGMPRLFCPTHVFFESSFIYYGERPDLMSWDGTKVVNNTEDVVCWHEQAGGLEGLRQKGWSVLNLLVILREAKVRNTRVRTLAQSDNQVICTQYRLPDGLNDLELGDRLHGTFQNNLIIMSAIIEGTSKLGLIINQKETLIASDYLCYGKVPVVCGNIEPLEGKRYSRITCIPNDQLPSLTNAVSSVATNSLTVAQFSRSIRDPLILYCTFGCLVLSTLRVHSALMRGPLLKPDVSDSERRRFVLRALYLDPSLGGISGMSLTRFLIRMFPDPVTEGLSFWKAIAQITKSPITREVALAAGSPILAAPDLRSWAKLLEKPNSLNIPKGLSATTLLRNEIRSCLVNMTPQMPNQLVAHALNYLSQEEDKVLAFLRSIEPLFPRFLSEFYAATFLGVTESIVGLFQNSRTIRTIFQYKFSKRVGILVKRSEVTGLRTLLADPAGRLADWTCSSALADRLRLESWGAEVYGTTVPHPFEMLSLRTKSSASCRPCMGSPIERDYVSVIYPHGLDTSGYRRGRMCAYMGSNTLESTSLFMPWEKETKLPLLDRASKLRSAINWFVAPGSNVAKSILGNLTALTGLDREEETVEYSRTGSALHRFYSSRQSNGGFAATSPSAASWVLVTTDTMPTLAKENHDFMYQPSLLYSQLSSLETNLRQAKYPDAHHFHVGCMSCIRTIDEIMLDAPGLLVLPDVSEVVSSMSGGLTPAFSSLKSLSVPRSDWETLNAMTKSFHIGVAQGVLFGCLIVNHDQQAFDGTIFPNNLASILEPRHHLHGVLKGLEMAAAYSVIYHRASFHQKSATALRGAMFHLIDEICDCPGFLGFLNTSRFLAVLTAVKHRVPPSYPASAKDLGAIGRGFLQQLLLAGHLQDAQWAMMGTEVWIFSDFKTPRLTGLLVLTQRLWTLFQQPFFTKEVHEEIRAIKAMITYFSSRDRYYDKVAEEAVPSEVLLQPLLLSVKWCPQEIRHAARGIDPVVLPVSESSEWGSEWIGSYSLLTLWYGSMRLPTPNTSPLLRVTDPLISGLRPVQLATGAHYKLWCILPLVGPIQDFVCGGDGSGGMTAALLRWSTTSHGVFNSLMDLSDRHLRGVMPGPPSAILAMPTDMQERCVNLHTCWEAPSDLSDKDTWEYFMTLKNLHQLDINLIVLDMEVTSEQTATRIEELLREYLHQLLSPDGSVIMKMYATRELVTGGQALERLGPLFVSAHAVVTSVTSSHSSEFYLVGRRLAQERVETGYLLPASLTALKSHVRASKTLKEEFDRAVVIQPADMTRGVPPPLIPDPVVELVALYASMGLETGSATDFGRLIDQCKDSNAHPISLILSGLCILSNSIAPLTRWILRHYAPPSDQALQRLYSIYIGTWQYLAWLYREFDFIRRLRPSLENGINFSYRVTRRTTEDRSGWSLEWDWNRPEWKHKFLVKLEHPATCGQVIRTWSRFWGHNGLALPPWSEIELQMDRCLYMFNRYLSAEDVRYHSGLLFPLFGVRDEEDDHGWTGAVSSVDPVPVEVHTESSDDEPGRTWEN